MIVDERVQQRLRWQEGSRVSIIPAEDLHPAHVLQHPDRLLLAHRAVEGKRRPLAVTLRWGRGQAVQLRGQQPRHDHGPGNQGQQRPNDLVETQ